MFEIPLVIYLGIELLSHMVALGFSCGSLIKNLPANARSTGSIPGLRRSPGEGNDSPLQHGKSHDQRVWQAKVHGVAEELEVTQGLNNSNNMVALHLTFWGITRGFTTWLLELTFALVTYISFTFFTSSSIFAIVCLYYSHLCVCEVASHCGFDLPFTDG